MKSHQINMSLDGAKFRTLRAIRYFPFAAPPKIAIIL